MDRYIFDIHSGVQHRLAGDILNLLSQNQFWGHFAYMASPALSTLIIAIQNSGKAHVEQ